MDDTALKDFIGSLNESQLKALNVFLGEWNTVRGFDLGEFSRYTGAAGIPVSDVTVDTVMRYMDYRISEEEAERHLQSYHEAMRSEGGFLGGILRRIFTI
jgi:hypothetical protein